MSTWMKPPGSRVRHLILTPRDPKLAQRHSACDRLFLLGFGTYVNSKAKKCQKCLSAVQSNVSHGDKDA